MKGDIHELWCFDQLMTPPFIIKLIIDMTKRAKKKGNYIASVDLKNLGNNDWNNKCRVTYRKLPK